MSVKVSIVMLVYNHARFLAQALDSILAQETDFDYELIVGEDCSPDDSRAILREYEAKFGIAMKPQYRDVNLGIAGNLADCLGRCRGEYIAFLEGDDYWTDPQKLQRQADFLDAHPDFLMTYHNCDVVDINGGFIKKRSERTEYYEYSLRDFESFRIPGQTCTLMARNETDRSNGNTAAVLAKYRRIPIDRSAVLLSLTRGRIAVLPESMSAYRYYLEQNGTNWSSRYGGMSQLAPMQFYFMKRDIEKLAAELGLPLDFRRARMTEFKRTRHMRSWKGYSELLMLLQGGLIVLMEGHPVRFLREYARIKDELVLD